MGLAISVLFALGIILVYRSTHRRLHDERTFLVSRLMMPPIVGLIMMLIGSNPALSIIRFRALIKDSRDQ